MTVAGELDRRVRLDKQTATDDPYGGSVTSWTEQFSRAAKIKPLQGSEPVMGQRLTGVQPVLIIVRFDSLTRTIDPSWRAVETLNGSPVRYYALKTVEDMEQQRQYITMLAVSGDAAGGDGP